MSNILRKLLFKIRDNIDDLLFQRVNDNFNSQELLKSSLINKNGYIHDLSKKTKELLDEKGFSNSLEDYVEKIVLLQTEISELADAVKKGLGNIAEGYELADIIIRATNFLCASESIATYDKLTYSLNHEDFSNLIFEINFKFSTTDKVSSKYSLIRNMNTICNQIDTHLISVVNSNSKDEFEKTFILLWYSILSLYYLCEMYCDKFLDKKVSFYVEDKMTQNFKRPFRYNTSY